MTDIFLRKREVLRVTGLSHSAMYALIAAGKFPQPLKLSERSAAWSEKEIAEWQRERVAARDGVKA